MELRRPCKICSASVTMLVDDLGRRWNIMDQADGFAGKHGGDIEITRSPRRRILRGDLVHTLHQLDLAAGPAPQMVVDQACAP